MKLLIVTQVIDTEHPILGFFHRWCSEFAKNCEHVHIICLQAGKHSLPANVTVHSLGKEQYLRERCDLKEVNQSGGLVQGVASHFVSEAKQSSDNLNSIRRMKGDGKRSFLEEQILKIKYIVRFYSLIWKLRHEYDNVFVHMNQIYVILGAPFWRTLGKKVGLWYAHGKVSLSLRLATTFADEIFTSTKEGFRIETHKLNIVGQGIDTDLFKPKEKEKSPELKLITVGRTSQSKNIETLIRACGALKQKNIDFNFRIIGPTLTKADSEYQKTLYKLVVALDIEESIEWTGSVSQTELPVFLQNADIFIHDGSTNSLDKTLIEASLCDCIVVSSNPAYKAVTKGMADKYIFKQGDYEALAEIITSLSSVKNDVSKEVSNYFLANYSISSLISAIVGKY